MKKPQRKSAVVTTALHDFDQASAFITTASADAAGWSAQVHDARAAAGPSVLLYVWDRTSDWIWVCSTPCDVFTRLSVAASREAPGGVDAIRGSLGQSIWRAATGKCEGLAPDVPWETELGSLVALYAGTTQVWQMTDRLKEGGHFIVMYYRQATESDGMLRPFALPVGAKGRDVLPVDELREVMQSVCAMDLARHPEWFKT